MQEPGLPGGVAAQTPSTVPFPLLPPQGFGWQKPFAPQAVSMKGQSSMVWQGYSQSCCW